MGSHKKTTLCWKVHLSGSRFHFFLSMGGGGGGGGEEGVEGAGMSQATT